jgi:hypothetical protein
MFIILLNRWVVYVKIKNYELKKKRGLDNMPNPYINVNLEKLIKGGQTVNKSV